MVLRWGGDDKRSDWDEMGEKSAFSCKDGWKWVGLRYVDGCVLCGLMVGCWDACDVRMGSSAVAGRMCLCKAGGSGDVDE